MAEAFVDDVLGVCRLEYRPASRLVVLHWVSPSGNEQTDGYRLLENETVDFGSRVLIRGAREAYSRG